MWRLVDVGRSLPVAERVERADTALSRLVGLLGRRSLAEDEGLWIEPCESVHTFFMRFTIDVAFVDRSGVVVRTVEHLAPWRATRYHTKARACVELPPGTLARTGVVAGSRLALVKPDSPQAGRTSGGSRA